MIFLVIRENLGPCHQPEAARGMLQYAQKLQLPSSGRVKESLLAKLAKWEEALLLYQAKLGAPGEGGMDAVLGCMKCLDALGQWQEVRNDWLATVIVDVVAPLFCCY